jgi:uncharacterized protein
MNTTSIFLFFAGLASGFIDSIAGGGGLISVPSLSVVLGAGAMAVGTSKVAGTLGTLVATIVYYRKGHLDIRASLLFAIVTGLGSFFGSKSAAFIPAEVYRWILIISCPVILWIVWKKDLWLDKDLQKNKSVVRLVLAGLLCGFYDGLWGPGSGTFMLLSLLFFAGFPLLMAAAASKLANFFSASTALTNYSLAGYVDFSSGIFIALGFGLGAYLGANLATKKGMQIARPVLVILSGLLMIRALS